MRDIKISIVVPLYNKQNAIAATLQSVLAQTYSNYEIIVVDDGSTDESAEVAEAILLASRLSPLAFRLIRKSNGGVSSARNRGIQEAKYDYIALLDGDDLWDEHYLEEQVKLIQDFPEAKMWGINFAERGGEIITKLPTGLPVGYRGYIQNYFEMPGRVSYLFCSSSVVISKEVFDQVEYFDERIKYAEDLDMWFRIAATYPLAFYDKTMVWYLLDAENRAMNRPQILNLYLPYFVDKYANYKSNPNFYNWIYRWSAQVIRKYYFSTNIQNVNDARVAVKKLDYSVLPKKYSILYSSKYPYWIAKILHKLDQYYHNIR